MGESIDVKVPKDAERLIINGVSVLLHLSDGWELALGWLHRAMGYPKLEVARDIYGTEIIKTFPARGERCPTCGQEIKPCKDEC